VLVASAGQGPDGVAVDVAGGHVYWTGMGNPSANDGFIMRSDLDGTNVKTLVPAGGTFTPKQMKLDVAGGKMYWSDREGMRVMRANLDGSSVEALVTTGQTDTDRMDNSRWCVGVALDLAGGMIYWSQKGPANGGVGTLRRAHLEIPAGQTSVNRTDIEILYDKLPEPIDIDVDLGAGMIYWTDRADNTVSRAPIEIPAGATAATRTDRQILVKNVATAIGVALDLPRGKVYYTSGANGALGRANLDGSQNEPLVPMAGNLTGIALGEVP
jgi:DNA-binding beta-propeller fold protein YncE